MRAELLPIEISRYFSDPLVTDILINNATEVWIERAGQLQRGTDLLPGQVDSAIERILSPLGRRIDRLSPIVDARLPDGTRLCAIIHPIAVHGTCVALRLFRPTTFEFDQFAHEEGDAKLIEVLDELVASDKNILITGATGSGKTSLLASLVAGERCAHSSQFERIVVLEDTHEIVLQHPHLVRLEARSATADGRGEVTLDDLLRAALRLRPDRLIVGEVRGTEALTLIQAMNTGHSRCLATLHANSALDGLHRLDLLTMQAAPGWTLNDARRMVDSAIGAVIHMKREPYGKRVISHIADIEPVNGDFLAAARLTYRYRSIGQRVTV